MSRLDSLSEIDVRKIIDANTRRKAIGYLNRIGSAQRKGDRLSATIGISRKYQTEINVNADSVSANCSCPYDRGGHCKHIGALLLKWVRSPSEFENIIGVAAPALELIPVEARKSYTPEQLPVWVQTNFSQRQTARHKQFRTSLSNYTISALRGLAKRRGGRIKGARKDDVLDQIVERLLDPAEILNTYHSLSDTERALLHMQIVFRPNRIRNDEKLLRVAKHWSKELGKENSSLTSLLHPLHDTGLTLNREGSNHLANAYYGHAPTLITGELLRHIPPLITVHEVPVADELLLADPVAFVRSANQITQLIGQKRHKLAASQARPRIEKFNKMLSLWTYDEDELAKLQQEGKLNKYSREPLTTPPPTYRLENEALETLAGSKSRLEWLYQLLVAVGILKPGSPVTAWEPHKMRFLQLDERLQQAIFARAYFDLSGEWHELWDILHAEPILRLKRLASIHTKPPALNRDIAELRQIILQVLASVPDDGWVSMASLSALLRRIIPCFDADIFKRSIRHHYDGYMPQWYITQHDKQSTRWGLIQKRFVQQILQILHWLGLADLGLRNGKIDAFRLHGLADLYWDRAETVTLAGLTDIAADVSSAEAITVTGKIIRVNPSAVSTQANTFFDQIAKLDVAKPSEFVYHLDPKAVHQTFEEGVALSQLHEQWQALFNTALPTTLAEQLAAWWDNYGQVRLYQNVTIIELADAYALAEMKAVTSLQKHIIAEISPQLILIPKQAVDILAKELQNAGYTPKLTTQTD